MHQRLAGIPVECGGDTIAEGIAVKDVGAHAPCRSSSELVDEVLVVEEETIERAVVALIEIEKTVAEGAGAAALAALLEHPERSSPASASACPISGGNIDSRVLASVLMRGLVRDGAPGAPARDHARHLGQPRQGRRADRGSRRQHRRGAAPAHLRHFLGASSPEVEFLVETRDREHTDALVRALEEKGIRVSAS